MHIKPIKTQKIAENVFVVRTIISNFYIYTNGENTLCFDTGYMPLLIKQALKKLDIQASSVSHIFLTHSDYDHTGGIRLFENSKLYISADEIPMITYKKPRLLLLFNKKIKKSYQTLKDGDILHIGKIKIQAIATPGHTPGSMSYMIDDTLLFTGDTLTVKNGKIKPFFWLQNMNSKIQKESIKKIVSHENIHLICTGHSGFLQKKVN